MVIKSRKELEEKLKKFGIKPSYEIWYLYRKYSRIITNLYNSIIQRISEVRKKKVKTREEIKEEKEKQEKLKSELKKLLDLLSPETAKFPYNLLTSRTLWIEDWERIDKRTFREWLIPLTKEDVFIDILEKSRRALEKKDELLIVKLFSYALRVSTDITTITGAKRREVTTVKETPIRLELFFDDFISSIEDEIDFEERFRKELEDLMKSEISKNKNNILRALGWLDFTISETISFGIEDKIEIEIKEDEEITLMTGVSSDKYTIAVFLNDNALWYLSDHYEHEIE